MNESFGGTYMIYIFMVFVAIYIVFISLVMNYVRAFKVKNQIINYIEQYESYNQNAIDDIAKYSEGVDFINPTTSNLVSNDAEGVACVPEYGYCVQEHVVNNTRGDKRAYYTVYVYVSWNFPLLGLEGNNWVIKGETRMLNKLA